jgi:hypothetical protein
MPFITVTYPPKYPLTESEKKWLEVREKRNFQTGYYLSPWAFPKKTLYWVTEVSDTYDAAEFEARVSARLTGEPPYAFGFCQLCKYNSHGCQKLRIPLKQCRLKHARLAVEAEMEQN